MRSSFASALSAELAVLDRDVEHVDDFSYHSHQPDMDPTPPRSLRKKISARSVDLLDAAASVHNHPPLRQQPSTISTLSRPTTGWSEKTYFTHNDDMPSPLPTTSQQNLLADDSPVPDVLREHTPGLEARSGSAIILYSNGEWRHVEDKRQTTAFKQFPAKFAVSEDLESTSNSSPQMSEKPPLEADMSSIRQVFFVMTVCLAQLLSLAALAQTIAPVLIISEDLGVTDQGKMTWYTAAYGLTLGSFILPAGRLGDVLGHKRIFIIGWIWFALWSLVCGFSYRGGYTMLVAARAFQGMGPALLVPNGVALLGRTFPMGLKRNLSIACFGGMGPVGFVIGAAFSALCAEDNWWPWPFWALAITCTLTSLLSTLTVPTDHLPPSSPTPWHQTYDIPGMLSGVLALILINFAFNQGASAGWHHTYIPFLLALGLLSACLFIYIETRTATHPLLPLAALTPPATLSLALIATGWASHGIWLYGYFTLLETLRHQPPLTAVLQLLPVAPLGLACALSIPLLLRRGFSVSYIMLFATLAFALGTLLLATAPLQQSYWANTFLSILVMPLGMNWSFPAGCVLLSNAVSREHQGIAASLVSVVVNYSISTGLGMAGTVERYVGDGDGQGEAAWRAGLWFALALDGVGVGISGYFVWRAWGGK